MTRSPHPCTSCDGHTRHADRRCSRCRHTGQPSTIRQPRSTGRHRLHGTRRPRRRNMPGAAMRRWAAAARGTSS